MQEESLVACLKMLLKKSQWRYYSTIFIALGILIFIGSSNIEIQAQEDEGEPEQLAKKTIKTTYTYNTKLEEYDDGTKNAIVSIGMVYANSSGVKIEDAISLKTCEFCSNIKLDIQEDPLYPIEVIDYNYTSITLNLKPSLSTLGKNIDIKVIGRNNDSKTYFNAFKRINEINDKRTEILPFGFDKVIKWGENSTTIVYATSNTGWLRDTDCDGVTIVKQQGAMYSLAGIYNTGGGRLYKTYIEIDTTSINTVPDAASLNAWLDDNIASSGIVKLYQCDYGTFGIEDYDIAMGTEEGDMWIASSGIDIFHKVAVATDYINLGGMTQYCLQADFGCSDAVKMWAAQTSGKIPYLNLTYPAPDTCSPSYPLTADHLYDASDNCVISSDLDAGGYNIICSGSGTLDVQAEIYNVKNVFIHGGCNMYCRNTPTCFR